VDAWLNTCPAIPNYKTQQSNKAASKNGFPEINILANMYMTEA
jgi:hypothetical protein